MEDILKKQRADDDDKSLMNKIHTGVTACLRMAGVAAPLPNAASGSGHQQPQQQGQAPPGQQQGVPPAAAPGQQNSGGLGFINPFNVFAGPAGGAGQAPSNQGAAVPGTHPRAAEAAWGIPDAVTVQAGIFAGLKKIDEMYGRLNAGSAEIGRRPRSASRGRSEIRRSRSSRKSSRSSRKSGRSDRASSRGKKSRSVSSDKAKKT